MLHQLKQKVSENVFECFVVSRPSARENCSRVMWLLIGGTYSHYNHRLGARVACSAQSSYKRRSSVWTLCNTRISGNSSMLMAQWIHLIMLIISFIATKARLSLSGEPSFVVEKENLGFNLYSA